MDSDLRGTIAVVGPTASGKTRCAVVLAKAFDGEIVSADSRQVYRGMDIGTGKDIDEYGDIPYHLIDICQAGEKYNLYRFLADYRQVSDVISSHGKRQILCGGSGMYVEAAINGMVMPEVPRNESLRESLQGKTLSELTDILSAMKTLHNVTDVDTVARALRAIEIQTYYIEHPDETPVVNKEGRNRPVTIVGIDIDREQRRENITARLYRRLEQGMIEEVNALLDQGVSPADLIYYGLEYKWVTLYLTGEVAYEKMVENLEIAIHQFAKRQMTWFRGMERRGHTINWIPYGIPDEQLIERVSEWVER